MNSEKTLFSKINTIIALVLILMCVAGCCYIFVTGSGLYYYITAATEILALFFAITYFAFGAQKNAAKYYRLFMLFYAFTYPVESLAGVYGYESLGVESAASGTIVAGMILYGNTLLLALGKDLGKKVSYILCAINVVLYALPVLGAFIPGIITFDSEPLRACGIILYCTWLVMALCAFAMTVAKYSDKSARGTN